MNKTGQLNRHMINFFSLLVNMSDILEVKIDKIGIMVDFIDYFI